MNQIMESLLHLLNNPMVESNVRHLISSVIELRRVGWGDGSNFMPHASTTQLNNLCPVIIALIYNFFLNIVSLCMTRLPGLFFMLFTDIFSEYLSPVVKKKYVIQKT
jgi:hypothetical protein